MISPSFVVPWLMISLGASLHVDWQPPPAEHRRRDTAYGLYVLYLMPAAEDLAVEENHVVGAICPDDVRRADGFALAYLL
jgi:hypothetical protein